VARRFKVNKTLTWNIARTVQAGDSLSAAPHVPGLGSMESMLRASEAGGAPTETVERVRAAVRSFDRMVELHVGDRAGLDLLLDSMGGGKSDGLELSRKLAFRGNSGILGVQARTRLMCWLVSPNADDSGRLDLAMVSGYVGFRRLRPSVRWPIFKIRHWADSDEPLVVNQWEPIDPDEAPRNGVALLRDFTRGNAPTIKAVKTDDGIDCEIQPGPIGNAGAFDCFRGEMMRGAASRYRTDTDETGEFGVSITTPSEHLIFDLIAHRDLEFVLSPDVLFFSRIFAHGERTGSRDDATLLPIRQQPVQLSGSPPAVATRLIPGYAEILRTVTERLGMDPAQFRGVRLHLRFPPLGSTVTQRFTLPEPPD
jgi:hypothetical protein